MGSFLGPSSGVNNLCISSLRLSSTAAERMSMMSRAGLLDLCAASDVLVDRVPLMVGAAMTNNMRVRVVMRMK